MLCIDGFDGGVVDSLLFRQSLLGLARSSTIVSVLVDGVIFIGRVVAVDFNIFELALITSTIGFPAGSIVTINFGELGAIAIV